MSFDYEAQAKCVWDASCRNCAWTSQQMTPGDAETAAREHIDVFDTDTEIRPNTAHIVQIVQVTLVGSDL